MRLLTNFPPEALDDDLEKIFFKRIFNLDDSDHLEDLEDLRNFEGLSF